MSPRLIIALALTAIVVLGAGVGWFLIQPQVVLRSSAGVSAAQSASDTERKEYKQNFFSGDPERDVRGGQEMTPRW